MAKRRQPTKAIREPRSTREFICATEGGARQNAFGAITQDRPPDIKDAIAKARKWYDFQWFVRAVTLLRYDFFNFGFKIKAVDPSQADVVTKWASDEKTALAIANYVRDAWLEWLVVENVVALWRKEGGPTAYDPELVEDYSDKFNVEVLTLKRLLSDDQIRDMKITGAEAELFRKPKLVLTHDNTIIFFEVLKRAKGGKGFGLPSLATVFQVCSQSESMEVRDSLMAAVGRNVIEHWKIGHEIKSGLHAGNNAHFCNKEKAQTLEQGLRGKTGHTRIVTNFDRSVSWPGPDTKEYEGKKYIAVVDRLSLWSMPLGQMVLAKTLNPYLLPVLKVQAAGERELIGPHISRVLKKSLNAPVDIRATWSNRCFTDPRLAADMVKNGLNAGPVSQETYLETSDLDPAEERKRKDAEAKLPKEQTTPIYDAAHGAPKAPGRNPGSPDNRQ